MLKQTTKIIKKNKREVIYKIITSLFIEVLALIIPIFWSKTITEVTDGTYKVGYYLVLITASLTAFYYFWAFLNQKTWFNLYNKLYLDYTNLTISKNKNINSINLGEYTNTLNNDIDIICNFLVNTVTRILQIIEFVVIYSYFLSLNYIIFIITIVVSIIMLLIYIRLGNKVQSLNIKRKKTLDNKTIKLHNIYNEISNSKQNIETENKDFTKENKLYLTANYKYNIFVEGIIYFVLGTIELTRYGIIFFAIYLVEQNNIEIGTILLIYSYYDKIINNFNVLGTITADYQSFIVSLKRLNKITESI